MKSTAIICSLITIALVSISAAHGKNDEVFKPKMVAMDEVMVFGDKLLCVDDEATMADCLSFIKGFLQGALLTDTAIIKSTNNSAPALAERAFANNPVKLASAPTALAGFCLPQARSVLDIADETLEQVKGSERNSAQLAKDVYDSLKMDYPCE
ncbi:MAG: hypothetical protein ACJAQ6_000712 [Arenicella sp.]|jgi:hypothetical protein